MHARSAQCRTRLLCGLELLAWSHCHKQHHAPRSLAVAVVPFPAPPCLRICHFSTSFFGSDTSNDTSKKRVYQYWTLSCTVFCFSCCWCVCVCVCVCACVPAFTKLCQHTNSKNKHTLTLTHLISFGPARSSQLAFDSRGRISSNGPEHLVYRLGKAGSVPNARTIWLLGHRLSCTQLLVNTMVKTSPMVHKQDPP